MEIPTRYEHFTQETQPLQQENPTARALLADKAPEPVNTGRLPGDAVDVVLDRDMNNQPTRTDYGVIVPGGRDTRYLRVRTGENVTGDYHPSDVLPTPPEKIRVWQRAKQEEVRKALGG